jgi:hypothetical protein
MVAAYRRGTYRAWLADEWQSSPMVAAWLGPDEAAAPVVTEPATPQDEGNKPAQRSRTQARALELAAVLDSIESRARELEWPLVRSEWPGTKAELRKFLEWHNSGLCYSLPTDDDRLTDELRPHGVLFLPGNNKGKGRKFYKTLFPEYPAA